MTHIYGVQPTVSLVEAVRKNDLEAVVKSIEAGADVNVVDKEDGQTLLLYATFWRSEPVIDALVKAGAKVDFADKRGDTAICHAARMKMTGMVRAFIKHGADVDANNGAPLKDVTGLFLNMEIATMLIEAGADVNINNGAPLKNAIWQSHLGRPAQMAIVSMLIGAGANVNIDNGAPLLQAIKYGERAIVTMLARNGADLNIRNGQPLLEAIDYRDEDTVGLLIRAGANVNIRRGIHNLLLTAARFGNMPIITMLIEAGVNTTDRDSSGNMAEDYVPEVRQIVQDHMRREAAREAEAQWRSRQGRRSRQVRGEFTHVIP